jgi:hypothetical protein
MVTKEIVVTRFRWQLAALSVEVKLLRLSLVFRAYNPGQPRVPAGHPDGGQWTSDDGSVRSENDNTAHIYNVSNKDKYQYNVVLEEEEKLGGHTIESHVGKTDEEMMERVRKSQWGNLLAHGGLQRDGSFDSRESANDLVNRTLEINAQRVDEVASGEKDRAYFTTRFGYRTGREAYITKDGVMYMRNTYGVAIYIVRDRRSSRGYHVQSAFPYNEGD